MALCEFLFLSKNDNYFLKFGFFILPLYRKKIHHGDQKEKRGGVKEKKLRGGRRGGQYCCRRRYRRSEPVRASADVRIPIAQQGLTNNKNQ